MKKIRIVFVESEVMLLGILLPRVLELPLERLDELLVGEFWAEKSGKFTMPGQRVLLLECSLCVAMYRVLMGLNMSGDVKVIQTLRNLLCDKIIKHLPNIDIVRLCQKEDLTT
jgi:hypothetical protein